MKLFLASALIAATQADVCLWGTTGYFTTGVNGFYMEEDYQINEKPVYRKARDSSCPAPQVFIWWDADSSEWKIGDSTEPTDGFMGFCSKPDLSKCTKRQWKMAGQTGWEVDTGLRLIDGACPQWDCGSVSVRLNDVPDGCKYFDNQIAPNVFTNSKGFAWAFLPEHFTWRCIDMSSEDYEACDAGFNAVTEVGWKLLKPGKTKLMRFDWPEEDTGVTCNVGTVSAAEVEPIAADEVVEELGDALQLVLPPMHAAPLLSLPVLASIMLFVSACCLLMSVLYCVERRKNQANLQLAKQGYFSDPEKEERVSLQQ